MAVTQPQISGSTCCLCGGNRAQLEFVAFDFDRGANRLELRRCATCGLVRTEPACDTEELARYYAADYYGKGAEKFVGVGEAVMRFMAARRARQLARSPSLQPLVDLDRRPRALDIGCGRALMLSGLAATGWECHGVERDDFPETIDAPGVQIHRGSLSKAGFDDAYFDLIIIWHALEHFTDPVTVLSDVRRLLHPRGVVAI
ncbi:MAG: class I SAM-dependent methyltransferase, partial [Gammaproteobacteria bacterium]|nr:class I SAM-dependent methyltransferase [Gammaproteobacteria bacterium]